METQKMPKTFLDPVREVPFYKRQEVIEVTDEIAELLIAWLDGEITTQQIHHVMLDVGVFKNSRTDHQNDHGKCALTFYKIAQLLREAKGKGLIEVKRG